jgi:hypothetical protein
MTHHMKSGAVTLGILALAACSDTAELDSFEDSLTLNVAMLAADATIDEFGDMGLLVRWQRPSAPSQAATRSETHTAHLLRRGRG